MIVIEKEAFDLAAENMNKALKEYQAAIDGDASERRAALARYLEASGAYRTLLKMGYKLSA